MAKIAVVKGGGGHMLPKKGSGPVRSGKLVNQGGGGKEIKGGSGHMVGFTGARPAKPC
jgi:hypothetical protein